MEPSYYLVSFKFLTPVREFYPNIHFYLVNAKAWVKYLTFCGCEDTDFKIHHINPDGTHQFVDYSPSKGDDVPCYFYDENGNRSPMSYDV